MAINIDTGNIPVLDTDSDSGGATKLTAFCTEVADEMNNAVADHIENKTTTESTKHFNSGTTEVTLDKEETFNHLKGDLTTTQKAMTGEELHFDSTTQKSDFTTHISNDDLHFDESGTTTKTNTTNHLENTDELHLDASGTVDGYTYSRVSDAVELAEDAIIKQPSLLAPQIQEFYGTLKMLGTRQSSGSPLSIGVGDLANSELINKGHAVDLINSAMQEQFSGQELLNQGFLDVSIDGNKTYGTTTISTDTYQLNKYVQFSQNVTLSEIVADNSTVLGAGSMDMFVLIYDGSWQVAYSKTGIPTGGSSLGTKIGYQLRANTLYCISLEKPLTDEVFSLTLSTIMYPAYTSE